MVKVSTFLYVCDNLGNESEGIFEIDEISEMVNDKYSDIQVYLNNQMYEVDQHLVDKVLHQISQL